MRALLLILIFFTSSLYAASTASIQQLILEQLPDAHVGVYVQRTDTGEVLVNINGKQHFTPASITKLFTSYAALKTIGADFKFHTQFFLDQQKISQGIYSAPIHIKFSGDPTLRSADLAEFVTAIKAAGIKQITGPILLDISSVPAPYYARGWTQDDLAWYYAAPVSAAILDENKIQLDMMTSPHPQQAITARVTSIPPVPLTTYLVSASTQETDDACQLNTSIDNQNQITLYGCWPIGTDPVKLEIATPNPTHRVAQVLKTAFQAQQIVFTGTIKEERVPTQARVFFEHYSEPTSDLIVPILRDSNNLYAEAIAKEIGRKTFAHASFQTGTHAIESLAYNSLKVPPKSLGLSDGSGISIYNVMTPASIAILLQESFRDEAIRKVFLNSLAISGTSGTLQQRMKTPDLTNKFFAKTGTMSHVWNLAGYYFKSHQESPLIIILMINTTSADAEKLKAFETALMQML